MHLINQRALGILIVVLLIALIVIKRVATGSVLEKPKGSVLLWLVNIFNLFFLLIANPISAILLINEKMDGFDPSFLVIRNGNLLAVIEICGLIIYLFGIILMSWALIILGRNYQLGGADPRASDTLVTNGPYQFIQHPMYTGALCIALGLACLIQSILCLAVFCMYIVLIILMLPSEEESLVRAYGDSYRQYKQKVRKLFPFY